MTRSHEAGGGEVSDGAAPTTSSPLPPDSPEEAPARSALASARRWLVLALAAYPLVAVGLAGLTPLGPGRAAFLAALLFLVPALAVVQVPLASGEGPQAMPRVPTYVGSAAVILVLGAASAGMGISGWGAAGMGLGAIAWSHALFFGAVLAAATLALIGLFRLAAGWMGWSDSPMLARLLPRTHRERAAFVALSFAAGVGEELAYRSYAITALEAAGTGPWLAAAISSGAFGVLHAYQGTLGIARTSIIGFVLAASFIVTGSVWPAMVAHVLVDLVAGIVLGERLLTPPRREVSLEGTPRPD